MRRALRTTDLGGAEAFRAIHRHPQRVWHRAEPIQLPQLVQPLQDFLEHWKYLLEFNSAQHVSNLVITQNLMHPKQALGVVFSLLSVILR